MGKRITVQEAALAVVGRLREHGHEALWAGGSVRDMLLGREPADIDVATDATPERIIELFRRSQKVGAQFGVVRVHQGGHWIETATFRTDVDYQDGRRPEKVVFTTAEHDAQRRDFTINGLFYDPLERRVIDYVNGQADLRAGIIRAIGEPAHRFAEDHLRMLRAVRFATRFNFRIDGATADAIRLHAQKITRITPERIREELDKMLSRPGRSEALRLIAELRLLEHLWPESTWPQERVRMAVAVLAALPDNADFSLAMAGLLREVSPEEAQRVARALRCSNQQVADLTWLLECENRPAEAEGMTLAEFKRLAAHPRFDDLLSLHAALCMAGGRPADAVTRVQQRLAGIPKEQISPPPFVTGEDLIALGLEPGPIFKQILDELYTAQLNNELTDRPQALARLQTLVVDRK